MGLPGPGFASQRSPVRSRLAPFGKNKPDKILCACRASSICPPKAIASRFHLGNDRVMRFSGSTGDQNAIICVTFTVKLRPGMIPSPVSKRCSFQTMNTSLRA